MRFSIDAKLFLATLQAVLPAVPKRAMLPVLSAVRIGVGNRGIVVEGTNLDVALKMFAEAEVAEAGASIVPARALAGMLKGFTGVLAVEGDDAELRITNGERLVVLPTVADAEWPSMGADTEFRPVAKIEARTLSQALKRAVICASDDPSRPVLTAVAFELTQGKRDAQVIATDSYRLGLIDVATSAEAEATKQLLMPADAAALVARFLMNVTGDVEMLVSSEGENGLVWLATEGLGVILRQVEGEFPNWKQLMPTASDSVLEVDSKELEAAVKAGTAVLSAGMPIKLALDGCCDVVAGDASTGLMRETLLSALWPTGSELTVAFNPGYLVDALRFIGGQRVHIQLRDALKAAVFKGERCSVLLMPVRP